MKRKTFRMLWIAVSLWTLLVSLGLVSQKIGKLILGFFNFIVGGFESWSIHPNVSFGLAIFFTYLMVLVLLRLVLFIENKIAYRK